MFLPFHIFMHSHRATFIHFQSCQKQASAHLRVYMFREAIKKVPSYGSPATAPHYSIHTLNIQSLWVPLALLDAPAIFHNLNLVSCFALSLKI